MFADETGWGFIFVLYVIPFALIIWFIDVGLKKWLKTRKKIFGVEFSLILIGIVIYQYSERIKTLEIISNFDKEYVSIVYGIENTKDLGISIFDWSKTIKIPENGILFTSSNYKENLPETKMKFDSGIFLGSEKTDRKFSQLSESEFTLDGKTYQYRTWKIEIGSCCLTSTVDIENAESELKKELKREKASR